MVWSDNQTLSMLPYLDTNYVVVVVVVLVGHIPLCLIHCALSIKQNQFLNLCKPHDIYLAE